VGGREGSRDVCPRRMRRAAVATTARMAAEEMRRASASAAAAAATAEAAPAQAGSRWARVWPPALRWIPTSTDRIIAAEKRLLSIVKYGLAPSFGPPPLQFSKLHANWYFWLLTGTVKLVTFSWTGTATHLCLPIYQITCQLVQTSFFWAEQLVT
jgi:hypothetical protein